jgi:hypothetical protein
MAARGCSRDVVAPRLAALLAVALLAGCAAKAGPESAPAAAVLDGGGGTGTLVAGLLGVVVDAAIRPVPNATVVLEGKDVSRTTSSDGSFSFLDLAPGAYLVRVTVDPYLSQQVAVELASGAISQVRIVLEVDPQRLPYNVTHKAEGFADVVAPAFFGGTVYRAASDNGVELCDCLFDFLPEPGAQALVLEAVMADCAVEYYCIFNGFTYALEADGQRLGNDVSNSNPMRVAFTGLDGNASHYRLQLYPTSEPLPEQSKSFQVFATFFYRADPPEGWSFVAEDPPA